MATKKPAANKTQSHQAQVSEVVNSEIASQLGAVEIVSDKQWLEETAQRWEKRDAQDKQDLAKRDEGQAVMVVADASGAVGASLILADASTTGDNKKAAVKLKDDESHDKGGYIWGGLGLLGLVGIAAAAGGGGGDSAPAPTPAPLALNGLVIDDPVANAVVFRDYFNDGLLHVKDMGDGHYVIDSHQSVVVTNASGAFTGLTGSGKIISAGINALPIYVTGDASGAFSEQDCYSQAAGEGAKLYATDAKELADVSINDGKLAYIVGENQQFDGLVISSGVDFTVGGNALTLVTGVTALVDAYIARHNAEAHYYNEVQWNNQIAAGTKQPMPIYDITNLADVKTATIYVASLFGYTLSQGSSNHDFVSFLLGGYDAVGIQSPNNLNQEIYAVLNALTQGLVAVQDADFDLSGEEGLANALDAFNAALNAILIAQEARVEAGDANLATFATSSDILSDIFNDVVDDVGAQLINPNDIALFVDLALNHSSSGNGAPDIYETYDENQNSDDPNLVNILSNGVQLTESEVTLAGDISVISGVEGRWNELYLGDQSGDTQLELLGSNINVVAQKDFSYSSLDIQSAENAHGTLTSNGTYAYNSHSAHAVALGDVTVESWAYDASSDLNLELDGAIAGDILVAATGDSSDAEAYIGSSSGSGSREVQIVRLGNFADLVDQETDTLVELHVGDVTLTAILDQGLTSEDVNADSQSIVEEIIRQWSADPSFAALNGAQLQLWSEQPYDRPEIRILWPMAGDQASASVEVNNSILAQDSQDVASYTWQEGSDQDTSVVLGSNEAPTNLTVNAAGFDSYAYLDIAASTGVIGDISVQAGEAGYAELYADFSGDVVGDITVVSHAYANSSYDTSASVDLEANIGQIVLNEVDLSATAYGGGEDFGYYSADSVASITLNSGDISGSITGIDATASDLLGDIYGYTDTYASIDVQGDVTISSHVTATALGATAEADISIGNNLSQYYNGEGNSDFAVSHVVLDNVEIAAVADGSGAYANIDLSSANATGVVTGLTAEGGSVNGIHHENDGYHREGASVSLDLAGSIVGDINVSAVGNQSYADVYAGSYTSNVDGLSNLVLVDTHIEVNAGNNEDTSDWTSSATLYLDASGQVDGITVSALGDTSSSDAFVILDGVLSGDINVLSDNTGGLSSDGYWGVGNSGPFDFLNGEDATSVASLFTLSNHSLELDHVAINVDAAGEGANSLLLMAGEDVTGQIDGITITSSSISSDAFAVISADVQINNSILVQAAGEDATAVLAIQNIGADETSAIHYNDVDITVNGFGENGLAVYSAGDNGFYFFGGEDSTNATGTINSITVTADSLAALDDGLNGTSADASADIAIAGLVGDIAVSANHDYDDAELSLYATTSGHAKIQFFDLGDMFGETNAWSNLQARDVVSLNFGTVTLTATAGIDVNDNYSSAVEALNNVIAQFEANPNFDDLNIVLSVQGNSNYYGEDGPYGQDGLWVRWLNTEDQVTPVFKVDGQNMSNFLITSEDNIERLTSVEMDNSVINVDADGYDSYASLDITDATGQVDSLTVTAHNMSSDAYAWINLGGTVAQTVTVEASSLDSYASVNFHADSEALVYAGTDISVSALGEDSGADFSQDGYATGHVNSISAIASSTSYADADVYLGGDITIDTALNVYAFGYSADSVIHLNNEFSEGGLVSHFNLDGVVINVEAIGSADVRLNDFSDNHGDGFSSDTYVRSEVTGHINELNVLAGIDHDINDEIDVYQVSGAESSVDLNLHGQIDTVSIDVNNTSSADVYLQGDIRTVDQLVVDVNSVYDSRVYLDMQDLTGDIVEVNVASDERASADVYIQTQGAVLEANIRSNRGSDTYVALDVSGSGNFVETLNITTLGTSTNYNYMTSTDVNVSQQAHGGQVFATNSLAGDRYAETYLSYSSDYQADEIYLGYANPGQVDGTPQDGYNDSFNLSIDMTDADAYNNAYNSGTLLQRYETTIYGINDETDSYDATINNDNNNYIQFAQLDDDDYSFIHDGGGYDNFGLSHYSNGLNGWQSGNGSVLEFSSEDMGDGYYGTYNELYAAAQYGIASDYAMIDIDQFNASNSNSGDTLFNLVINYTDEYGNAQTLDLESAWQVNVDYDGLYNDVSGVINLLDDDWDYNNYVNNGLGGDHSGGWNDRYNVQLFDGGDGMLGIRIGEGDITSVHFETNVYYDGFSSDYGSNLTATDDFIGDNNGDFNNSAIDIVDGGGYFFGMLDVEGDGSYVGMLAMDEDGEGVTKFIKLDGVTDYGQFTSSYIGSIYDANAFNYNDFPV